MSEKKLPTPNFTQIPNVTFDYWAAKLSPSAFMVLSILCRKIFGWHKTTETISKNQLIKVTGMSKNTTTKAVDELVKFNLVIVHQIKNEYGHQPNMYSLNITKPEDEIYTDQKLGGGRSKIDPPLGQKLTPQKKELNKYIKESKPKKAGHSPLASNDAHASSHFSILEELVNMLLVSIISLRPSFKVSGYNLHKWHLAMDLMIRRDSREIEEMKQVLEWLPSNEFWNANILSASKFRKQYDKLCIEMEKAKNDESKYKIFAFKAKKHCNLNNLNVSNLGVYDKYSKFELSYKMPYEDFCRCLAKQYSLTEYEGDM